MIPKGLFTQIGIILSSLAIIFTYIQPQFEVIGATQDKIAVYQSERNKIDEVNNRLRILVERMSEISAEDERRLNAYLPEVVDELAVIRDLQFISERAGVIFNGADYEGEEDYIAPELTEEEVKYLPVAHAFSMNVLSSYSQLKELLYIIETNEYPLEIHQLDISGVEGGFLDVQIRFITYSHMSKVQDIVDAN